MAPYIVEIASVIVYRRLGGKFAVENCRIARFEIVDADLTVRVFERIAVADEETSVGGVDSVRIECEMRGIELLVFLCEIGDKIGSWLAAAGHVTHDLICILPVVVRNHSRSEQLAHITLEVGGVQSGRPQTSSGIFIVLSS